MFPMNTVPYFALEELTGLPLSLHLSSGEGSQMQTGAIYIQHGCHLDLSARTDTLGTSHGQGYRVSCTMADTSRL